VREAHALKREMGPIALSAQYQQSPVPPGGTIIKRKWLKTYDELRLGHPYSARLTVERSRLSIGGGRPWADGSGNPPMGLSGDAVLVGDEPSECKARLDEITNRLRHEFELAE